MRRAEVGQGAGGKRANEEDSKNHDMNIGSSRRDRVWERDV